MDGDSETAALLQAPAMNLCILLFQDVFPDSCAPTLSLTLKSSSKFRAQCPKCTFDAVFRLSHYVREPVRLQVRRMYVFDFEMINFLHYGVSRWAPRLDWSGTVNVPPVVTQVILIDKMRNHTLYDKTDVNRRLCHVKGTEPILVEVTPVNDIEALSRMEKQVFEGRGSDPNMLCSTALNHGQVTFQLIAGDEQHTSHCGLDLSRRLSNSYGMDTIAKGAASSSGESLVQADTQMLVDQALRRFRAIVPRQAADMHLPDIIQALDESPPEELDLLCASAVRDSCGGSGHGGVQLFKHGGQ